MATSEHTKAIRALRRAAYSVGWWRDAALWICVCVANENEPDKDWNAADLDSCPWCGTRRPPLAEQPAPQ